MASKVIVRGRQSFNRGTTTVRNRDEEYVYEIYDSNSRHSFDYCTKEELPKVLKQLFKRRKGRAVIDEENRKIAILWADN